MQQLQDKIELLARRERDFQHTPFRKRRARKRAWEAVRIALEDLARTLEARGADDQARWLRQGEYHLRRDGEGLLVIDHEPLPW